MYEALSSLVYLASDIASIGIYITVIYLPTSDIPGGGGGGGGGSVCRCSS